MDAVVDRFHLRPVIEAVCQWLCSIGLAVVERSGELSPPAGREEKQYAHGCWLVCLPMPVVKLMTYCKMNKVNFLDLLLLGDLCGIGLYLINLGS